MPAIVTISDLFAAGADFEVESFLSGEVQRFSTITEQLQYNLGADFQASPEVVGQFVATVQAAMESGREIRAMTPPDQVHPPSRPDIAGTGICEHRGAVKITPLDENGEPIDRGVWLPFSINNDNELTVDEIRDLIANSSNLDDFVYNADTPGLRKRRERLGYNQLRYSDQQIDVRLTSVYCGD